MVREGRAVTDVWLSYMVKWADIGEKAWLSEKDRADKYVSGLL